MSKTDSPLVNLPTADDVRAWRDELTRLAEQEQAIAKRRASLERFIRAAEAFIGDVPAPRPAKPRIPQAAPVAPRNPRPRRGEGLWTKEIMKAVRSAGAPVTYADLKAALLRSQVGPRLKETEKAFHGGIKKLHDRGILIRYAGRVYLPEHKNQLERDMAAGPAAARPVSPESRGIYWEPVRRMLSEQAAGMTSSEIHDALQRQGIKVTNFGSVQNLLSRHVKRGLLAKEGARYKLLAHDPGKEKAPTGSEPEGAFEPRSESGETLEDLL